MTCHVSHLEAAIDGTRLPAGQIVTVHEGRPIWVRYDLEAIRRRVDRNAIQSREATLWRYSELLPLPDESCRVSLGEVVTPRIAMPRLGERLGVPNLFIKDESRLPTGSFKSRGMAMAISMARHFGVSHVALPSAGNAGGAAAAYAARAGIGTTVMMPRDTPAANVDECRAAGAEVRMIDGLIDDCGKLVAAECVEKNWFNLATLREPYRIEGKKTMGLEIAEQFDWRPPEVILYPTGGGTGLIGIWKAMQELTALGWLETKGMPRMIACQSSGCAPVVRAFEAGERFSKRWENAATIASGLRVPAVLGDFMILDAVRESGGIALAMADSGIAEWTALAAASEGLMLCPETAICVGALIELRRRGLVQPEERVLLINTAAASKYPPLFAE